MKDIQILNITKCMRKDERGWSISPEHPALLSSDGKGSFHITSMVPGCVRGNHKHLVTEEWIAVWGANILFAIQREGGEKHEMHLDSHVAYLIHIPQEVYHAFKNVDQKEGYLYSCFMEKPRDYENEIVRKTLLS